MGFTSMDDLTNQITANGKADYIFFQKNLLNIAVAGAWSDLGVSNGSVPASTYGGAELTFTATDDTWSEGAIYHGGDVSTATKHLMGAGGTVSNATGSPWLLQCVDMVGYVKLSTTNVSTTGVKTVTMTPIGSSAAKVDRYPDGVGLRMFVSCALVNMGANAPTCTIQYTNSAGTTGRNTTSFTSTASMTQGYILNTGAAANKWHPFLPLQAGDTGVKDIESLTWAGTAHASGTVIISLVKPLFTLPIPANGIFPLMDFVNNIPAFERIRDGANLRFLLYNTGATPANSAIMAEMRYAYGG